MCEVRSCHYLILSNKNLIIKHYWYNNPNTFTLFTGTILPYNHIKRQHSAINPPQMLKCTVDDDDDDDASSLAVLHTSPAVSEHNSFPCRALSQRSVHLTESHQAPA